MKRLDLVVGLLGLILLVLNVHLEHEALAEEVDEVGATVFATHLYLVVLLVDVVVGDVHVEQLGQLLHQFLDGDVFTEALCEFEGITQLDKTDLLLRPLEVDLLDDVVVLYRHYLGILEVDERVLKEVDSFADESCQLVVDCLALRIVFEMREVDFCHKERTDDATFLAGAGVAHLIHLENEIPVGYVDVLRSLRCSAAEEFCLGKGEDVHIGACGF